MAASPAAARSRATAPDIRTFLRTPAREADVRRAGARSLGTLEKSPAGGAAGCPAKADIFRNHPAAAFFQASSLLAVTSRLAACRRLAVAGSRARAVSSVLDGPA